MVSLSLSLSGAEYGQKISPDTGTKLAQISPCSPDETPTGSGEESGPAAGSRKQGETWGCVRTSGIQWGSNTNSCSRNQGCVTLSPVLILLTISC